MCAVCFYSRGCPNSNTYGTCIIRRPDMFSSWLIGLVLNFRVLTQPSGTIHNLKEKQPSVYRMGPLPPPPLNQYVDNLRCIFC